MEFIPTDIFLKEVRKFAQNKPNLKNRIEDCLKDDKCYYLNFWTHSSLELSGWKKLNIRVRRNP